MMWIRKCAHPALTGYRTVGEDIVCLTLCATVGFFLTACGIMKSQTGSTDTRVDPQRGKKLLAWYGCESCHEIPASRLIGRVGPPLRGVARRSHLAGRLPNTPENMMHWIRHPHRVDRLTVMPDMRVTEEDAHDIAAFLYSLR